MRIAHLSDLHFYAFPRWMGIASKRIIGMANLYLKGRIHHFSADVAKSAIGAVVEDAPDGVIISGDLTALASHREFELAREALEPILSRFPTVIIPGNHDYYTQGAAKSHRIEQYFGDWIRTPGAPLEEPTYPTLHLMGEVAVIGMNPNRAGLGSSGKVQLDEIGRLEALLQTPTVKERFKILVIHYPLFNRFGKGTTKYWRRLENRVELIEMLLRKPVGLVLHGHDHMRYLNHLHPDGSPPTYIYNSGSAAFSRGHDYPIRATYNLYEIAEKQFVRVVHKDHLVGGWAVTYDGPPSMTRLEGELHAGEGY